jgi:type II secretory pathway predicted ATPase ExeA
MDQIDNHATDTKTCDDALDIEDALSAFSAKVVEHSTFSMCQKHMHTLRRSTAARARHHRASRPLHGATEPLGPPRGVLLTGPTGSGKSTIAKHFAAAFPAYDEEERTVIPIVRIELPGQPRANVIAEQLLTVMGDPLPDEGSAEHRMERVRRLMIACGVILIIIDEVQHITDNLDARQRDIAADTLKNLMNLGIPIVFIGLPSARAYFVKNQQLGRRCTPKISLKPFSMGTVAQTKEFMSFLKSLDLLLPKPFCGSSALIQEANVAPLFMASHGLVGQLTQLIEAALRLALTEGNNTLRAEHLSAAFLDAIFPGCEAARNPFDPKFNGKPLDGANEPYAGIIA